jgi:hypothetical protein
LELLRLKPVDLVLNPLRLERCPLSLVRLSEQPLPNPNQVVGDPVAIDVLHDLDRAGLLAGAIEDRNRLFAVRRSCAIACAFSMQLERPLSVLRIA